jgi:hypothetical protein
MRRLVAPGILACALLAPLVADAAKPPKPKPAPKPAPPGKVSLTLAAKPAIVTYGRAVTFSGQRKGTDHGGKPVALQSNPFPFKAFKTVAVVKTDTKGNYRFVLKPRRHTRYRTVTPEPATIYDTVIKSPELLEHVRLAVGIRLSDSTPARGQRVRFFGSVLPKHNRRKVFIQRRRADGRWRTVARTLTRNATGNRSKYSKRVRIRRTGVYRVRVRGHADHSTNNSRVRLLRVH